MVDRQVPLSRALLVAGYCCSILVTRASPRWAWLQCHRPAGDRCSLTASCLLNGASPLREVASPLWRAGSILGRLGEAWPPSGVSLPEGAHRPWAAMTARRGWHQGHHGNSAAPDGLWPPRTAHCARRAPGFGGGRLYCSHTPSHCRYVDADFEGMILTALWEPASWSRPSRGRLLGAGPPAASLHEG